MTITALRKVEASRYQPLLGVPERCSRRPTTSNTSLLYQHVQYSETLRIAFERSSGRCRQRRLREAPHPESLRCTTAAEVRRPGYPVPAQRQAEVLGTPTHAQLSVPYHLLALCSLQGIGCGQRQLIAVTCIAEHA